MAQQSDADVRLRVFALVLRYGHELFSAEDLASAAASAVNDAHDLVPFKTSSIFETTDGRISLLGQYAQATPNSHSEQALADADYIRKWLKDPESVQNDPQGTVRFPVKIPLPSHAAASQLEFVWLIEFEGEKPNGIDDVVRLLSTVAGQALAYHRLCRTRHRGIFRKLRKSTFWTLLALALAGIMFLKVPESTTAEFSVRSPNESTIYAWFDGSIENCLKRDGDRVKAGDVVVRYDISQLNYRMALAKNQLAETKAELELVRQNSFSHPDELGRVKLLELRCESLRVSVEEAKWYVEHSEVRSPVDGVVALTEGDSAKLENRAVRTGDVLFRILGGEGFEAEIPVDEHEASVLRRGMEVHLFLHTAPEKAIASKIILVSHYPQLTDQKVWAYRVRVALDPATVPADLRYGMRGIAKLESGKVRLGYRLFKSVVLYFRGL